MIDSEITRLLSQRDKLLTRRDGLYSSDRVARIEAKLRDVPPGVNNEVDKALGRMCAVIEKYSVKPGWSVNPAVTLENDETKRLIETTQRLWNEAQPIEY